MSRELQRYSQSLEGKHIGTNDQHFSMFIIHFSFLVLMKTFSFHEHLMLTMLKIQTNLIHFRRSGSIHLYLP